MKKTLLYSFLPLLVAMMMGVTFTACGDDEDDPTENNVESDNDEDI